MQRWVLHIDMDAFFASVEQLTRPTLKGRPVLVGGVDGRGVVAGASYEARALGARSAMPMFRAQQLIGPRGVVVRPRHQVYSIASRKVFDVLQRHVEVVEQLSIDEGFMEPAELQGAAPAVVEAWANDMRARILEETGLPSSIGAGPNKQSAKIASGEAKPDGTFIIPAERQLDILHPLPVTKLWGVGPVTEAKLRTLGVETIGQLAAMSEKEVDISLGGVVGRSLWAMARGIDDRPVAPRAIAKQISSEHTYPQDLITPDAVDAAVVRAAQGAHRRLLKDSRGARTVTVKLRMADFHIESRSATLPYATDDFDTLLATAMSVVRYPAEVGPIRLVGVSLSGLDRERQEVLFPELDRIEIITVKDTAPIEPAKRTWVATQDIRHSEYGHGWVQGTGHGVVSVRFETRSTGPGPTRSFAVDDPALSPADPADSLDWD